jgi:hypothetical protein
MVRTVSVAQVPGQDLEPRGCPLIRRHDSNERDVSP